MREPPSRRAWTSLHEGPPPYDPSAARTRSPWLGPESRPVAIPDDIDDPTLRKASGVVELPLHIAWSEPSLAYDLSRRADRLRVYEQVLREGTEDEVRYYIDVEELARVFDELVLPPPTSARRGRSGSAITGKADLEC